MKPAAFRALYCSHSGVSLNPESHRGCSLPSSLPIGQLKAADYIMNPLTWFVNWSQLASDLKVKQSRAGPAALQAGGLCFTLRCALNMRVTHRAVCMVQRCTAPIGQTGSRCER